MTLENFCREVYQYFYKQIYDEQSSSSRNVKSVELYKQFVQQALDKYESIGSDFVWLYMIYQFGRFERSDFQPSSYTKRVEVVNVFGKIPFDKFVKRRQELDDLSWKQAYLFKYAISKEDFTRRTRLTFDLSSKKKVLLREARAIQQFISPVKEAASKTGDIDTCEEFTDLYNSMDPSCQKCPSAVRCKQLLQKSYPHLYKLKGYE
jgi:hypothetical protein